MSHPYTNPELRQDFVILFDVTNGNPNGDPDAGNLPRVDPETMHGLVTDVCIKRKIRNYVGTLKAEEKGYRIYIQSAQALNALHREAYEALGLKSTGTRQNRKDKNQARKWMCEKFYDIRTFGAVMTTGVNCGQVRGPVQLTFARSIDPIVALDLGITRMAITREEETAQNEEGGEKTTEMGRKPLVPYGLYIAYGLINPMLAKDTGFSQNDLELLWEAIQRMWDLDRSASRGLMALRGLYVFTHSSPLGEAPAHELFELINIKRKNGVEVPRDFRDYEVNINREKLRQNYSGITLTRLYPDGPEILCATQNKN